MTSPHLVGGHRLWLLPLVAALAACSGQGGGARGPAGQGAPLQVGYVTIQATRVPVTVELGGRVSAWQTSEVRPQVSGVLQKRLFVEGSLVQQGQTLYRIDPSLYRAAVDQAEANLRSAQASAEAARTLAERYRPLAAAEAVAKQDYTNAVAQARQAEAAVAQNRAALATARINLGFTRVPAPISGRIGRSLVTEGALVTNGQTDALAVIQRLDPIFVDIQQSSADLLALRRALARGEVMPASTTVRLKLEDGSDYGETGTVEFAEVTVDPDTGTVTLRARFPNPHGVLLPGMFVRATFAQAVDHSAFLVPQQAVTRNAKGVASVFIVGPGDKALERVVTVQRTDGANWVVTDGLQPGDKVIVQTAMALKPNAAIKPMPVTAPQTVAPPAPKQGG